MTNKFQKALLLSALMALLLFGSAYAYVITIDGDPSEWQISMNMTPPEDGLEELPDSIDYGVDIAEYWATNDGINLYYRFDTWTNTDWDNIQVVAVCMDVNAGTHASCGANWGCDSAADFALVIDPSMGTTELLDADTCNPVPGAVPDAFSAGPVTEISVPFSGLGLNATNCNFACYVNTQIILQYGLNLTEADLFPDTGYFAQQVGEGSPTSLGLVSFSAGSSQSAGALDVPQVITLAATILMLVVVVAWRRALTYPK
jgi:hypothetical protein